MLASISDFASRDKLRTNVLNLPVWEEVILFASERLARGNREQQKACGAAIMSAIELDPILAAEMIFRSNDAVWAQVDSTIQELVKQWHTPGKVDRALRFMISSGRHEFYDEVWPLITHENDQVHLRALRAGRRVSGHPFLDAMQLSELQNCLQSFVKTFYVRSPSIVESMA